MFTFYKKRKSNKLKIALLAATVLVLVAVAFYTYQINRPNSKNPQSVNFVIEPGQSSMQIGQNLKKAGLIKNPVLFEFYAWQKGLDDKLQAGEHQIPTNLSIKDILKILTTIKLIEEDKITIIEGWTLKDIANYLDKRGIANYDDFMKAVQKKASWWDEYDFLKKKPRDVDLEGYLFPDTYRIYKGATIEDILRKMLDNFNKKLTPEMQKEIARQDKSIHEILTLASILEKEVNTEEDRKKVAGIFYKRLNIGMPLQADSTINYVTGKNVSRASRSDTETDSPYNTYKYRGLPPGPINNPGISAIKAAIYPQSTPYLYFLTTPDGQVIYSRTHDEHVAAKAKYYKN
jgi:UPF0755 protein